jgi:hypothetical protein
MAKYQFNLPKSNVNVKGGAISSKHRYSGNYFFIGPLDQITHHLTELSGIENITGSYRDPQ